MTIPPSAPPVLAEEPGQSQQFTDLGWTKKDQQLEPLLKGDSTMPDDATLLNWLEATSGAHALNPTLSKTVRFSFDPKSGLRAAIVGAMYDEAAHEAQRRGWEYEPEDGTWRKEGYLQCVEEALIATINGGAA